MSQAARRPHRTGAQRASWATEWLPAAPTRSSPVPTQSGAEGVDRTGSPPGGGEHRVAHDGQG